MQNGFSQSDDLPSLPDESNRSIIGLFPSARKAHDAGLAVLAAGSPYWVHPYEGKYALVVRSKEAKRLEYEVRVYRTKNRFWPPLSPELPEKKISAAPTWAFLAMLVIVFFLQGSYPKLDDLGMVSSLDIRQNGSWWRVVTAATLHADLGHLAGNMFGAGLFGYFAARYFGNGLAWTGILLCAALANTTNVLLHWEHSFNSLGASTAVFSALGLVTGFPIGDYFKSGHSIQRRQWIIPLAGGLMLFAWLGSGDFPTDVSGHLWSFLYGLTLAILATRTGIHARVSSAAQRMWLALCWVTITNAWVLALLLQKE